MPVPYDSFDYQEYWEDRNFEDVCERVALGYFFKKIEQKNSLLDIGGGYGRLTSLYIPLFKNCTILDPSKKLLEIGKKNFRDLFFVQGSLPKLPFKDNSFNVALMIRVSHHLLDLQPSFKEINRILTDSGFLILEVANKIHFLAIVKSFFSGNFSYFKKLAPVEKRSSSSIKEGKITFVNHHPRKILDDLKKTGFSVVETLSVSNLRSSFIKKFLPKIFLVFLEKKLQKPLGKIFFGPSIFFLVKKG